MHNIHSISHHLQQALKPAMSKFGYVLGSLAQNWPQIIGKKFYKDCFPERLSFQKGTRTSGVLTLAVQSYKAIYFQQIQIELMDRINAHLGYAAIGEIRFLQKPILYKDAKKWEQPIPSEKVKLAVAALLEGVEEDTLRASLQNIGEVIYSRKAEAS